MRDASVVNRYLTCESLGSLGSNIFADPVHIDAVRSLNGETECPRPHTVGEASNGTGNCEDHGVVSVLDHSEVLKACSTVGVHVGEGVLYLADLAKNAWNRLITDSYQINDIVVLDMSLGEFLQMQESWVSVPQNCMAIAWDDLTFFQGLIDELLDDCLARWLPVVIFLQLLTCLP